MILLRERSGRPWHCPDRPAGPAGGHGETVETILARTVAPHRSVCRCDIHKEGTGTTRLIDPIRSDIPPSIDRSIEEEGRTMRRRMDTTRQDKTGCQVSVNGSNTIAFSQQPQQLVLHTTSQLTAITIFHNAL